MTTRTLKPELPENLSKRLTLGMATQRDPPVLALPSAYAVRVQ